MAHGGAARPGGKGDASGGVHVVNPFPLRDHPHNSIVQNIVYSGHGRIKKIVEVGGIRGQP